MDLGDREAAALNMLGQKGLGRPHEEILLQTHRCPVGFGVAAQKAFRLIRLKAHRKAG